ncbi:unnamed protein product [Ectocarpus sp. 13 AM-2016]
MCCVVCVSVPIESICRSPRGEKQRGREIEPSAVTLRTPRGNFRERKREKAPRCAEKLEKKVGTSSPLLLTFTFVFFSFLVRGDSCPMRGRAGMFYASMPTQHLFDCRRHKYASAGSTPG